MYQSKEMYRSYFVQCRHYVKMNKVFEDMQMDPSNFYRFMKSEQFNFCMSLDLLEEIKIAVSNAVQKIT